MADLDRRQRITAFVNGLPLVHRVVIGAAVVVALVVGFMFFRWLTAPTWVTVASGVESDEVTEITNVLADAGIDSRVTDGPLRVEVPRADRYQANAALAQADINFGSGEFGSLPGSEALPGGGIGTTQDLQDAALRRALEGDISRVLAAMDFVDSARVSLVTPEPALFEEDQQPVQASVALELRSRPTGENIDAVTLFVANAVEGLTTDNMTVVDTDGRVWHSPMDAGSSRQGGDGMTLQRRVETTTEARIQRILDDLDVQGSPIVTADINMDSTTIESITVDPDSGVATATQVKNETLEGIGNAAGGIPGVDGGADVEIGEDGTFTYTLQVENTETAISEVRTTTIKAVGELSNMSVAIAIDDGTLTGAAVPAPDQVLRLVESGLGLDVAAGDNLVVEAFPFAADDAEDMVTATAPGGGLDILGLVTQVIGGLALLLVVVFLFLLARRKDEETEELEPEELTLELEPAGPQMPDFDTEASEIRNQVIELVRTQPEDIAGLLRTWISER